jgi:peptidylprolyl isomerase
MKVFQIGHLLIFLALLSAPLFAEPSDPPAVGEAFGKPILKEEFDFALKTTGIFNVSGQEPASDQERRNEVWKHITFLREATKRGIQASQEEVAQEMTRLLAEKNIAYGSYNYHEFVKANFQEDSVVFEKRVRDLLTVKKMLDTILHPPAPKITDQDAKQKFLNQYNSMATEFVRYPTLAEAQTFHKSITKKKWDAQKAANKKWCTPTGHISLEALIDLWQVPTQDAYRIHAMELGKISAPAKMVNGYGVFRLIEKKSADLKDYTEAKKKEYFKVLEQVYYYDKTQKVIQDIVKEAALKDYARDKFVTLETTQGTIELALFTTVAPKACENFMGLIDKKYYDGLLFHRIIKGFMIQGGDPTGTGTGGASIWGKPFEDEVNKDVQFEKGGILAMANSGPNTNNSQFFITLAPTPHLNMKHTIFGQVANGYDVLKKLGDVETNAQDRPKVDQKIVKMTVKKWPTSLTF